MEESAARQGARWSARASRTGLAVVLAAGIVACLAIAPASEAIAGASQSAPVAGREGYSQTQFQADLDAIVDAGISGVQGRVNLGYARMTGHSGVADTTTKQPVADNGYFRMGSNTKTFVAVVLLQLVREGRISLDDTVDKWLPGVVSGNGNDGRAITIRHLMQQTSGLYNYTNILLAQLTSVEAYLQHRLDKYTPEQLVALAMTHAPRFAPGTSWAYSNTNYILLGMVINKVTGRQWYDEVRCRILLPLGLVHTFYPGDKVDLPDPHAAGYTQLIEGAPLLDTTVLHVSMVGSAGSLITTTADLSRFWQALQRGVLLRPAQMAEMRRTVLATAWQEDLPGVRYGLGIWSRPTSCGGEYWGHGGDVPGYVTVVGISANGNRTVVLSLSTASAGRAGEIKANELVDHVMCAAR